MIRSTGTCRATAMFCALAALALAGCSERQTAPIPGAALILGTGDGVELPGVTMALTPGTLRTCEHPDGRMVAKVAWNAKSAGVSSVTIWVSDATTAEKSWYHGPVEGSADTGPWVGDGAVFRMADGSAKQRTLAVLRVHAVNCMAAAPAPSADPATP
ncbi:hypothetical protein KK141_01870 [Dyella sp. LX-66]|uniref:hypothetical protein n=1 Tax=unclassified Dyella TaxID=2634549 RepID=UPI001BDFAAAE|nr:MULTISPECIES: hypothetical protein [unclassified Dyella]MBT2117214.1 hypothetical protein [Dyella sp. LX-1]MBT2138278.1 hypothetical protein [Dyella sp. LX-66]